LVNALSIDLEEWYHPQLVQPHLRGTTKTNRVAEAAARLLDLLDEHGVRATFFCVGEVLDGNPELARRIHESGHEVGFHGMTHRPLGDLGPAGFERELDEFALLTRRLLGESVRISGFRAPTFSLDRRTSWALPMLVRRGYAYDSSVFPMRSPLYGVAGAPLGPYRVDMNDPAIVDPESPLTEIPPAVLRFLGVRMPVAGGIYLRMLPLGLVTRMLRRVERERPFVLYVHPWETDPGTPRVALPWMARLATYHGIPAMLRKLDRILSTFRFTTVAEVVEGREGETTC
jgi:polysaccharide deacetylase family protein (PEP-CTERM system associated)